jgi:hypothetical protein
MTLRLSELDPLYRSVPREEAIAIANLGAQCYSAVKDRLYANWEAAATEDATERAAVWRKEGGATMLESLRAQLAAGEAAQARIAQLQSGWETEVSARVETAVSLRMKELELTKREEMLVLESAKKEEMLKLLSAKKEEIMNLETAKREEILELRAQLAAGAATHTRITQLQSGLESELSQRVESLVAIRLKETELTKRQEILDLRAQLAAALASQVDVPARVESLVAMRMKEVELAKREEIMKLEAIKQKEVLELRGKLSELQAFAKRLETLDEAHGALKEKLLQVTEELAGFKATKSSHALGKIGEATVFEILETYVAPKFSYAEVVNVSKTKHVGDIHMTMMMTNGKYMRIMIDVKNYTSAITAKEIEKLYSDLDEHESDVGLMVSLESSISKRSAFQITKTPNGKPCMFLSLENIEEEQRKEILCWAVRALLGVVSMQDHSSQTAMIAGIKQFLTEMSVSLELLEASVKTAKAHYEGLRDVKLQMVDRVQSYRLACGMDPVAPVISAAAVIPKKTATEEDLRCSATKPDGTPCKLRVKVSGGLCKHHGVTKADIITLME